MTIVPLLESGRSLDTDWDANLFGIRIGIESQELRLRMFDRVTSSAKREILSVAGGD